jgi:hypothetical protein
MKLRLIFAFLALAAVLSAQRRVDPRNTYVRVICVVPLVGEGTKDNPKRPQFVPESAVAAVSATRTSAVKSPSPAAPGDAPNLSYSSQASEASKTEILAFVQQVSDDGKYALVEFVARDRAAFAGIMADKSVKVLFEKDKAKKDDIERELKKYKKDFDLSDFGVVMP